MRLKRILKTIFQTTVSICVFTIVGLSATFALLLALILLLDKLYMYAAFVFIISALLAYYFEKLSEG
ncbi:TMhelix containing protein [Vibrio phage 1.081.O._10N.286.52.C2]|nr:TMhelix containing protein [Vibrio phage 1.081.O._10N.286.52.C2]